MNYALIIAGGSGNRMGQDIPKQFMHVDNCPIIIHTMMAFQKHPDFQGLLWFVWLVGKPCCNPMPISFASLN